MRQPFLSHTSLRFATTTMVVAGLCATSLVAPPQQAEASTPGYNGKISFYTNRDGNVEGYMIDPDGSNAMNATNYPGANSFDYSCNRDNTRCLFGSDRTGDREIYAVNPDGSDLVNLTNNGAFDNGGRWSPNGSKILFASSRSGYRQIYVMNADGSGMTALTSDTTTNFEPSWSPDGSKIAFSKWVGAEANIFIMDADGSNAVQVTTDITHPGTDNKTSWSPDGTRIAFASNRSGTTNIYLVNNDGTNRTQLTSGATSSEPSWSPDGTKIIFARTINAITQLAIMNTDGTELQDFESGDIMGAGPQWQTIANTAPVTSADTLTTLINTSGSANVLANDNDEEAFNPANLTVTTQPIHGTAAEVDGKITYTPDDAYLGDDQLTYQICDSFMLDQKCSSAVLSITVTAGPTPATPTITKVGTVTMNGATKVYYTSHRPTFSGTAEPGSTVKVEIHSDPIVLTTTADSSGAWSVTPNQDIPDGEHQVNITATKDGSTSSVLALTLVIDPTYIIPDTGASFTALRIFGGVLLAAGAGTALLRRQRGSTPRVPSLFP